MVAFDTEFLREKTYFPQLGLLQIADAEDTWLIDPLAVSKQDLQPLLDVLTSPDVLKVAHHGSADPGLPTLLERLKPRIAAIEVGKENTYGHPAPSTLAALKRAVPTILRTDRDGTTRLHAANGRIWIER